MIIVTSVPFSFCVVIVCGLGGGHEQTVLVSIGGHSGKVQSGPSRLTAVPSGHIFASFGHPISKVGEEDVGDEDVGDEVVGDKLVTDIDGSDVVGDGVTGERVVGEGVIGDELVGANDDGANDDGACVTGANVVGRGEGNKVGLFDDGDDVGDSVDPTGTRSKSAPMSGKGRKSPMLCVH